MKYERFEDTPVWQAAIALGERIYALTRDRVFSQDGDLRDQLRRAVLSVSNNVAEGFERGSTAELITFLYYARGSAGEVRSSLHFCNRLPEMKHLSSVIDTLVKEAESCSRQLRGWADHLQNSEIKGQRHLNDKVRDREAAGKRAKAVRNQIAELLHDKQPQWFPPPKGKQDDEPE